MKLRSIFLTLFLSFAGISLTGCWLFENGSDDSGKSVEDLKTEATGYIEEANAALEGNTEKPECAEAVTAVTEAKAAVDAMNEATTKDEAKGVKNQAKDAKDKAEKCAGGETETVEDVKKAVIDTADEAIALADAELKKSQDSNRNDGQKEVDIDIFGSAKTAAEGAKTAAEAATTMEQANEAKTKAEAALQKVKDHVNALAGGDYF